MDQLAGQMDMFSMLRRFDPLDDLVRRIQHEGARLRIFAALTFPHFQQYADRWMRHEYTGGVYSSFASAGYSLEYSAKGATCTVDGEEYTFTWAQMVARARELILEPDWLSREEERIVNDLRGELPYPYPCSSYPAEAWHSAPHHWQGICTRCATLDTLPKGACPRCGKPVRKLTVKESLAIIRRESEHNDNEGRTT